MEKDTQPTPEQAYNELLKIHARAQEIKEQVKDQFKYSPFDYLPGKIEQELKDIRKKLVDREAARCREIYTPNLKPDVDFVKLMNEKTGDLEFEPGLIINWFESLFHAKEQLREKSLEQIIKAARSYVPYTSDGQEWGPLKDPQKILSGRILVLKCFSWGSYNSISYHLNAEGQMGALEALIDIVTLPGRDPATVKPWAWISSHVAARRQDPERFYGKHSANHPAVQAFQFFKNDKLKIWFKRAEQAEKVARALVSGKIPQAPLSPLFS